MSKLQVLATKGIGACAVAALPTTFPWTSELAWQRFGSTPDFAHALTIAVLAGYSVLAMALAAVMIRRVIAEFGASS